jgi:hypothetical protein
MIFIFPLVLSFGAALMFVLGDYSLFTKAFIVVLVVAAASMQFVQALAEAVHFLIPLFIQLIVCGWWYVANKLE